MSEKLATIKIRADLGSTEAAFAQLTLAAEQANTRIANMVTTLSLKIKKDGTAIKTYVHEITVAAQDANDLRNSLANIVAKSDQSQDGTTKQIKVKKNIPKDNAAEQKELDVAAELARKALIKSNKDTADIFSQHTKAHLLRLSESLNLQQAIRDKGLNSIRSLEIKAANDELAIKRKLASDLQILEEQIAAGQLKRSQANIQRFALISKAGSDTVNVQTSLETVKSNRSSEISTFKEQLHLKEEALAASIKYQTAIEQHGINSIQVAKVSAINQTKVLQNNLADAITATNNKIASGSLTAAQGIAQVDSVMKTYEKDIHKVNAAYNAQAKALENSSYHHKNLLIRVSELVGSYRLINSVINLTQQSLLKIPTAGIEQQATQASLFGIFGTKQGQEELKFLQDIAQNSGQSILVLEQAFRRFGPSALLAGTALEAVNKSFKDFSEVGSILHLTEDKMDSLFLALDQMFSKGAVNSEEIKKQLGNVLPAAVEIGAQAMGKSPAAFMKAMEKNEIIAKDFVPKFAELYRKIYGGVDDSVFLSIQDKLFANLMRLKTNYENFNRELFDSTQEAMNTTVRAMNTVLISLTENMKGILQGLSVALALVTVKLLDMALTMAVAKVSTLGFVDSLKLVHTELLAMLTFSNPITAIIGGIGLGVVSLEAAILSATGATLVYDKFTNTSKEQIDSLMQLYAAQGSAAAQAGKDLEAIANMQDKSNSLFVEFEGRQLEISSIAEATLRRIGTIIKEIAADFGLENPLITMADLIQAMYETVKTKVFSIITGVSNLVKSTFAEIQGTIAAISSMLTDIENRRYSGIWERAAQESSQTSQKVFAELTVTEADTFQFVSDLGKALVERVNENATNILTEAASIQDAKNKAKVAGQLNTNAQNTGTSLSEDLTNTKNTGAESGLNGELALISEKNKQFALQQKVQLTELANQYKENKISIASYYSEKNRIEAEDIQNQIKNNAIAQEIAAQSKNVSELEIYATKAMELEDKLAILQKTNADAKYQDLEKYNEKLREVNETILTAQGKADDLAISRVTAKYKEILELTRVNDSAAAARVMQAELYEKTTIKITALQKAGTLILEEYNFKLQKTTNLKQIGFITEKQALIDIAKIREETLVALDKEIELMRAAHTIAPANIEDARKLLEIERQRAEIAGQGTGAIKASKHKDDNPVLAGINKVELDKKALEIDFNMQNDAMIKEHDDAINAGKLVDEKAFLEKKAQLNSDYNKQVLFTGLRFASALAGQGAALFSQLTSTAIKMYGAQSTAARAAWAIHKAMAITEAIINGALAYTAALKIQPPPLGIALANATAILTAVQVATIIAQPMPAAHGGLTEVPEEQTYLLNKGERVLSPNQNKDFTNFIRNYTINNNMQGKQEAAKQEAPIVNVRNINVYDKSMVHEYIGSDEGEIAIMNIVKRNRAA